MDDRALIDRFVEVGSETAFAELTARYADQVYCAARRQLGDADKARDAAQTVFILLARKAHTLRRSVVLAAWLFRTTRLVASNMRKYDLRRQQRENKAATMSDNTCQAEDGPQWEAIQPHLDDSIARLCEVERSAVILSFFHKLSHKETGERLGLSEEAVRKRIHRALDKMRAYFHKRGITVGGELLAGMLIAHSVEAVPAGMAASLSAAASQNHLAADGVLRMVDEALHQMFWVKIKAIAPYAISLAAVLGVAGLLLWSQPEAGVRFSGMSDASAAVWAGDGLFLVADDELNHLNLYSTTQGARPLKSFDFNSMLALDKENEETDWEGATRLGDRSYWITSHGQNRQGKNRPSRHRLMAVDMRWQNGELDLQPAGKPYTDLVSDLISHPDYRKFRLDEAARRAPKSANALNIEGLCATPEGHLLIGFRNPVPEGRALLVRLLNPEETMQGKRARLAPPVLLDLGGLGIRDITRVGDTYYIIGGPVAGSGSFGVFEWREQGGPPRRHNEFQFAGLTPEALLIGEDHGTNWGFFLSDDGTLSHFGRMMKKAAVESRYFRMLKTPFQQP